MGLEPERWCFEHLYPGVTIFDVGAHLGAVSKLALDLGHPASAIHAFEPNPACWGSLEALGVSVVRAALAETPGQMTMVGSVEDGPDELLSFRRRDLGDVGIEHSYARQVEVGTLDDYCELWGIQFIDLLKIDVEGHEATVLKGGKRLLAQCAIGAVLFESLTDWRFTDGYAPQVSDIIGILGDGWLHFEWGEEGWEVGPLDQRGPMRLAIREDTFGPFSKTAADMRRLQGIGDTG